MEHNNHVTGKNFVPHPALAVCVFVLSTVAVMILPFMKINAQVAPANGGAAETFTVTRVAAENGSYTIKPRIPENGKVPAGTVLEIKAKPSPGYSLDAVYYTVKGGMWGTTSYESFSPKTAIKYAWKLQSFRESVITQWSYIVYIYYVGGKASTIYRV